MQSQRETTTETPNDSPHNRFRVWPWVVGVVVLGALTFSFTVWRQVRRVQQLREFAAENPRGHLEISYNHPPWSEGFISRRTYIPWSDGIVSYAAFDQPISDELLQALLEHRRLNAVHINVAECSPKSISELKRLEYLETVQLFGNGEPIPLEWTRGMISLNALGLHNIPVSSADWPQLMSLPHMTFMSCSEKNTNLDALTGAPYIVIRMDHLTRAEADALLAVKGLNTLDLTYSRADPEFWEVLGHLSALRDLKLTGPAGGEFKLSETELEGIGNLSILKILRLENHVDLRDRKQISPAWRTFLDHRPEVTIQQLSRTSRHQSR